MGAIGLTTCCWEEACIELLCLAIFKDTTDFLRVSQKLIGKKKPLQRCRGFFVRQYRLLLLDDTCS